MLDHDSCDCSNCGTSLSVEYYVRTVPCPECGTRQINPAPFPRMQEAMIWGIYPNAFQLIRVVRCAGPDRIEVQDDRTPPNLWTYRLDDVHPAKEPDIELEPGRYVYVRGRVGWETACIDHIDEHGKYVVRYANLGFQTNFFEQPAAASDIRIPIQIARPRETAKEAFHRDPFLTSSKWLAMGGLYALAGVFVFVLPAIVLVAVVVVVCILNPGK